MKIIAIIIIFFSGSSLHAEGVISFGGNAVLADFYATLDNVIQQQKKVPTSMRLFPDLPSRLTSLTDKLQVQTVNSPLMWRDNEVVMINYPELLKIEISTNRWQDLQDDTLKQALVLHETLPLMGLSDENYQTSRKLGKIAASPYTSDAIFTYLLSTTNAPELFAAQAMNYFSSAPRESEFIETYLEQDTDWAINHKDALVKISKAYFNFLGRSYCYSNMLQSDLVTLNTKTDEVSVGIQAAASFWRSQVCY